MAGDFKQIAKLVVSPSRSIAVAQKANGDYWINERVKTPSFSGFTYKGFGVESGQMEEFLAGLKRVLDGEVEEKRLMHGSPKELVIWRPAPNQIDIRHWVNSAKYTGYSKKGIRLITSNAVKLSELLASMGQPPLHLNKTSEDAANKSEPAIDGACESCGTTRRPVFSHGLCEVCYNRDNYVHATKSKYDEVLQNKDNERGHASHAELLANAFSIHGKKCYVCQLPYSSARNNMTLYYADGNQLNTGDNNIYPICRKCILTMPSH